MDKPNFIIIMTDQHRADLSRREGFALDTMPFLDSLAQRGVWFDKAYTSMPVCAPARVSMLTGRYPSAHKVRTNHNIQDAYYSADLFDVFRAGGYRTALIGKNHSHLTNAKADYWYEADHLGIEDVARSAAEKAFDDWLKTTHFHMAPEATPFPIECQIPHRLVTKAMEWIDSVERPFLLWLSFPEPHNPYQVPEPYYSMFPPECIPQPLTNATTAQSKGFKYRWCRQCFEQAFPDFSKTLARARANYLGMLRLLDDQIRRLVDFLDRKDLNTNTILVFLSDHGDFVGEYGLLRKGPGLSEFLVRIPLVFTGPGVTQLACAHPAHVSIVDVMPTLCQAAGISIPDGVQGRSLWPLITGQDYPAQEFASAYVEHGFGGLYYTDSEPLDPRSNGFTPANEANQTSNGRKNWGAFDCLNSWTQSGTVRMVRRGQWKLTFDMEGSAELYNLANDPAEMNNLHRQACSTIQQSAPAERDKLLNVYLELLEDLLKWLLWTQDPLPLPRRRYVMKKHPQNYRCGKFQASVDDGTTQVG